MSVYRVHFSGLQWPEKGMGSPEIAVLDGFKYPCECWELNPGPLPVQPVLLLDEPPLQLLICFLTVLEL